MKFQTETAHLATIFPAHGWMLKRWFSTQFFQFSHLDGFPINTQITKKIAQFSPLKRFGPGKCPVYLRVPWISKLFTNLEKEVKIAVKSCYCFVNTRLVFTSKCMLPVARKDVLSTTQKSLVIYEYKYHCDSRYVGRTSQWLQDRIKQHVPQWLRQQLIRPRRFQPHKIVQTKRHQTGL